MLVSKTHVARYSSNFVRMSPICTLPARFERNLVVAGAVLKCILWYTVVDYSLCTFAIMSVALLQARLDSLISVALSSCVPQGSTLQFPFWCSRNPHCSFPCLSLKIHVVGGCARLWRDALGPLWHPAFDRCMDLRLTIRPPPWIMLVCQSQLPPHPCWEPISPRGWDSNLNISAWKLTIYEFVNFPNSPHDSGEPEVSVIRLGHYATAPSVLYNSNLLSRPSADNVLTTARVEPINHAKMRHPLRQNILLFHCMIVGEACCLTIEWF